MWFRIGSAPTVQDCKDPCSQRTCVPQRGAVVCGVCGFFREGMDVSGGIGPRYVCGGTETLSLGSPRHVLPEGWQCVRRGQGMKRGKNLGRMCPRPATRLAKIHAGNRELSSAGQVVQREIKSF